MVTRALTSLLALGIGIGWALPSFAQRVVQPGVVGVSEPLGPTRLFILPRADILPLGSAVTSLDLQLSTSAPAQVQPGASIPAPSAPGIGLGFGYGGNALSLTNQMAIGELLQLDTGVTAYATAPWQGRLDVAGKMGLMQEKLGAIASLAGMAGVALNLDANGTPSLGFTLGVPITKSVAFTSMNRLTLSAYPNWGTGLVAPGVVGAGFFPPTRFALGLGGSFTLTDTLMILADTSLVGASLNAPNEGANLGVRFGYSPNITFDLYVSTTPNTNPNAALTSTPLTVSAGMNWQY